MAAVLREKIDNMQHHNEKTLVNIGRTTKTRSSVVKMHAGNTGTGTRQIQMILTESFILFCQIVSLLEQIITRTV